MDAHAQRTHSLDIFAVSMMQLWRYSDNGWQWLLTIFNEGVNFGDIRIIPLQIIFALAVFALLLSLVRWFKQDTLTKWMQSEPWGACDCSGWRCLWF